MTKPWKEVIAELRASPLNEFESSDKKDDVEFAEEIQSKLYRWSKLPDDALSSRERTMLSYIPALDEYLQ